jgi:hypothetical protein
MLAGALFIGPSLAGAQSSGDETIVAVAKLLRVRQVDLGPSGESPGDLLIFKDALWNEAQTTRIGTDWVACTLNFGGVAVCTAGFKIQGRGSLTGSGAEDLTAANFAFPITGGTGDFRNVTGELHVAFTATQEIATLTFRLSGVRGHSESVQGEGRA